MRKNKDISFDSDIQIVTSKSRFPKSKYIDILIAFLGVIGVTYVLINSFDLPHNNIIIIHTIICSVLIFSLIFNNGKFFKYTLLISALVYAIALYFFYDTTHNGFMFVWDSVARKINYNSNINLFSYNNVYLGDKELSISIFLIFTIIIISGLISFSIIYKPNLGLLVMTIAPISVLGLYFGNIPSYFPFELLILTWIVVCGMRTLENESIVNKSRNQFQKKKDKYYFIVREKDRIITTNIGISLAVITIIIFVMTSIIYPPSSYKPSNKMEVVQEKLIDYFDNFTSEKFVNNLMGIGEGGVNGGRLGTIDRVKYKHETALEVTAPWVGNDIYLKGFTGCEYTGDSWGKISDEAAFKQNLYSSYSYYSVDGFKINSIMTSILDYSRNEKINENYRSFIEIKNIKANNEYLYMPYNSIDYNLGTNMGIEINRESSMKFPDGQSEYQFDYYPNLVNLDNYENVKWDIDSRIKMNSLMIPSTRNNVAIYKTAKLYTDFVYDTYTILPDNEGLNEIKNKYSGRYDKTRDINLCIEEAIAAVSDGTTYDLAPGKLPEGEDFVEYFLYENKKGYCTHFASAATVILRAMGVPARYAEGYVVKKSDADNAISTTYGTMQRNKDRFLSKNESIKELGITEDEFLSHSIGGYMYKGDIESVQCEVKTMNINDTNAHAWVEIYVDSIGWIPIDVTPGFGDNRERTIEKSVIDKKSTPEGYTDNNTASTNTTKENVVDNNISKENDADNTESTQSDNYGISQNLKAIVILAVIIIIIIIMIIVIIIIRNKIISSNREKSFSSEDNNKNTHNIYKYLMKIFKYAGINNEVDFKIFEYAKVVEEKYSFIDKGEFTDIIKIIFKADFSQHKISKEEFEKVINFTNKFNDKIYNNLSRVQKFKYTYLKNLRLGIEVKYEKS